MLVQDEKYQGVHIKVLKFIEVSDIDEFERERSNQKEEIKQT